MKQLPDKLSDLIEVALADLEKVEKDPIYKVDMHKWHDPMPDAEGQPVCLVCLAGAVMAKTLEAPEFLDSHPGRFDEKTALKLSALNFIRRGWVSSAMEDLDIKYGGQSEYKVTPYVLNPEKFKQDLRTIAEDLRKEGY
jgi:hypothetical protein